jgi:50S ribosomal protein L16 3-hydroxylase
MTVPSESTRLSAADRVPPALHSPHRHRPACASNCGDDAAPSGRRRNGIQCDGSRARSGNALRCLRRRRPAHIPLGIVLQRWLGDVSVADFRAKHLGRVPIARPNRAQSEIRACTWDLLDCLLAADSQDVLVVARGRLLDGRSPHSLSELRDLFAFGLGIALRGPERCCSEVAIVARDLAADVPGEQRVIVFATPGNTHGFGWHYDAEDVFIIQTAGEKTYYFRRNSIDPNPIRGAQPDFRSIRREICPIMKCRLAPGDWLYLPRGYWHVAHAHVDSLSISIGVFPDVT